MNNDNATQLAEARARAAEVRRTRDYGRANAREMRFAIHYVLTLNGRLSCIRAGYSERNADQHAYRLLRRPRVQDMIRLMQDRYARDLRIETQNVLREWANIAFANMADVIQVQEDGSAVVDLSTLTREQAAALSEIQVDEYAEGRGDGGRDVKRVKVKFHSKTEALEALSKHLGIFERDNAQKTVKAQIVVFAANPVAAAAVGGPGAEHDALDG